MKNRCMFTRTICMVGCKTLQSFCNPNHIKQEQCDNMTEKQPNPSNNNRVYCDKGCQQEVDKINKEKFKGYLKKEIILKELKKIEPEINLCTVKLKDFIFKLENGEFE